MNGFLGLDTSNYTTSAAFRNAETGDIRQVKQLLPVRPGEMGLRQSDAVFHHVRQLPDMVEQLRREADGDILAVAASDRPQQLDGSYMPCFLVGAGAARTLGAALGVPVHFFTHQQGHVMAALYGSGHLELRHEPFLAFHVSGGTTDALLVEPDPKCLIRCRLVGRSLDLKAGQLIDRVGGMLGLSFPAGPALEKLALQAEKTYHPRATLSGCDCHLSGVENQCCDRLNRRDPPQEIARFCLDSIRAAISGMTEALQTVYGKRPLVYAGGVMSDSLLRDFLQDTFGGFFAPPVYSSDNAAGIAVLCSLAGEECKP